ncbi:hypothetical protein R50073_41650 [Maricurvus nonylphenolicus]|uniref:AraC family transcriptional regulator n=1 Tax=Maricurvus nonylphenolicus TaxID=1008307 RepID=UPI0036F24968
MFQSSTLSNPSRLVPSGSVIHLLRTLEEAGVDDSTIRRVLELDFTELNEKNNWVEAKKIQQAFSLALELPVPAGFWLTLGDSFSVHNYHLELSNWILTGKNFAELLPKLYGLYGDTLSEPDTVATDATSATHSEEYEVEGKAWLKHVISLDQSDDRKFQYRTELSAASMMRGYKSLLGIRELEVKFFFSYPEPAYSSKYHDILGDDITFDANQTEVHAPKDYLHQTFISSDPIMHEYYEKQLSERFNTGHEQSQLINRVETILLDYHGNFPSITQLCELLDVSERSLRRSLKKHNTSYRELLLHTKMKRAEYYLRQTDISIEEIAYRLDYSDYANFRRAFQAQHGETPSRYRKQYS